MSVRRVLYLSGTRADFGLMRNCLQQLDLDPGIDLSVLVTGMHLAPGYGDTVCEIEKSGLRIAGRLPTRHVTGTGAEMATALADVLAGMVVHLENDRPDVLLVLGDRGEILAGSLAAVHLNIHVAHIHGGEISGSIDEMFRHCVSKLAHLHFVTTERSAAVLRQLGEDPAHIFVTGAPGLDGLTGIALPDRAELCRHHGFDPNRPLALVLFHPVVQSAETGDSQMRNLLSAVVGVGLQAVVLRPNADAGTHSIQAEIDRWAEHPDLQAVVHLPRPDFLALMARADVMVGNSSSGVIEAASFGTPVVNVGQRQNARERNLNTRDCGTTEVRIRVALQEMLAGGRFPAENVHGDGNAGERIVGLLRDTPLTLDMLNKTLRIVTQDHAQNDAG